MCPDQESNQRPSSLRDDTQPTEPHQSGLVHFLDRVWPSSEEREGAETFTTPSITPWVVGAPAGLDANSSLPSYLALDTQLLTLEST